MTALRTIAILAAAAVVGACTAQASDLPSRASAYAPSYSPSLSNWQGFYIGAHLGGGFGQAGPVDTSGFVGGFQGGYNHQIDRFVIGGEADFSFSSVSNTSFTEKASNEWLGSLRGRAGYTFGNIMPYVTVGAGFGDVHYRSVNGLSHDTTGGWAYGFGAEMLVMPNVTLRAEYLRYELGSTTYPSAIGNVTIDSHVNVIRAGANYKF
jgi:outer membrane immunogenic protein